MKEDSLKQLEAFGRPGLSSEASGDRPAVRSRGPEAVRTVAVSLSPCVVVFNLRGGDNRPAWAAVNIR